MPNIIAVTHPGMIGDALWAVPAARELARRYGCKVDFWTSTIVEPAVPLLAAQDFINRVVIDRQYKIERCDCGVQPWRMVNADHGYSVVYHLGFRETPAVPLPEYCCRIAGLGQLPNYFDVPESAFANLKLPSSPYVVLAARGQSDYREMFRGLVTRSPFPVLEVGSAGQAVATDLGTIDYTGRDFLEMAAIISKCKAFVGLMSAPLVVANGFPVLRIAPHDGRSWDMRHVIQTPLNHYPVGKDPELILRYLR